MVRKAAAISRQYLKRATHRGGWIMRGKQVEGRLVWRDQRPGYDVVVDGRRPSWKDFGATLEPFEGLPSACRCERSTLPRSARCAA
jgi:hypothetical protein